MHSSFAHDADKRIAELEARVRQLEEIVQRRGFVVPRSVIEPSADVPTRARLYVVHGAAGAADVVKAVLKSAADTYSAKTVVSG